MYIFICTQMYILRLTFILERPSPTLEFFFFLVKRKSISLSEMMDCWKGVGVARSTYDDIDNKTMAREGAILYSSF